MKILQICSPQLPDVATLPWESQKVVFNSTIHAYLLIIYFISEKKTGINVSQGSAATHAKCGGFIITTLLQIYQGILQ